MTHTIDLPPNKGFDNRMAAWTPVEGRTPLTGVLVIYESSNLRGGGVSKPKIRQYAVVEDSTPSLPGRRFKLTKPGGAEFYHAFLPSSGVIGQWDTCECRAFETGKECCHCQALRGLARLGKLV